MTEAEIESLARNIADRVIARFGEDIDLMLHSVPAADGGSNGILINEEAAKIGPCRCATDKKICFVPGIIGALDAPQKELYCATYEKLESPGIERRLRRWTGAKTICKAEIEPIPKGERLEPWLHCMGRELHARGVRP